MKGIILFLVVTLAELTAFSQSTEFSECRIGQTSVYEIREMAMLEDSTAIAVSLDHRLGRCIVTIEKLNDSLEVVKTKKEVFKGDYLNFFTKDFKDVKLIVAGAYCYVFVCDRDGELMKLHAISLYVKDLKPVRDTKIVAVLNKGSLYDTNIRSAYDGYFTFSLNQYSEVLVTALNTREDVFKKKNSKRSHSVRALHYLLDCELTTIWETWQNFDYHSELELVDQVINHNNIATLIFRSTVPGYSYRYNLALQSIDLQTGEIIARFKLKQPEGKHINELKLFQNNGCTYLAGAYYTNNRKRTNGTYLAKLTDACDNIYSQEFTPYSKENLLKAQFALNTSLENKINKGKESTLSHFVVEHLVLDSITNGLAIIARFIDKPSSCHFRHQYFENFDGRNRDASNNESLHGGTIGVFNFNSELSLISSGFILRELKLPSAYMHVNVLESNGYKKLVYNQHIKASETNNEVAKDASELRIVSRELSIEELLEKTEKVVRTKGASGAHIFQNWPGTVTENSFLFQYKNAQDRCVRLGRVDAL